MPPTANCPLPTLDDLQAVRDFALAEAESRLSGCLRRTRQSTAVLRWALADAMEEAEIALAAGRLLESSPLTPHSAHGLPNLVGVLQASIEREQARRAGSRQLAAGSPPVTARCPLPTANSPEASHA